MELIHYVRAVYHKKMFSGITEEKAFKYFEKWTQENAKTYSPCIERNVKKKIMKILVSRQY